MQKIKEIFGREPREPLTPEEILRIKEGDEQLLEACLQQEKCGIPDEIE